MFVVDTNVLIYAADQSARYHTTCRKLLLDWRRRADPWYVTWGILYEFLRVSSHPRVFRAPFRVEEAWSFVQALLASPGLDVLQETDRHVQTAREVFGETPAIQGNLVFDAHTAVIMKENGVRTIYTNDADFLRFSFLDVRNPLG